MRAFLSHSSLEKAFVGEVAKELGRQYCVYDVFEFQTGDDFRSAIRKGLDKSNIFVLFASEASLKRDWVKFEIDEAELRKIRGDIKKFLVYVTDEKETNRRIPEWLQRGKVRFFASPKAVARDIDHHLQELIRENQHPTFVGRREEIKNTEEALIPTDGTKGPRAFLFFGLPGIGRRTLGRRAGTDILSLPKSVAISIESGDKLSDVAIKLEEEIAPNDNNVDFLKRVSDIEKLNEKESIDIALNDLSALVEEGTLPILFDQGGLLDNDGNILQDFLPLLVEVLARKDIYLAIVTKRRPNIDGDIRTSKLPCIRITELKADDVRRLLATLAGKREIPLNAAQISDLAGLVRGYPPAAFFAIDLVSRYGIESVLANTRPLAQFRFSYFISELSKTEIMTNERKNIIRLLAHYGALPLAVLGPALDLTSERLSESLTYLYDCAFVTPNGDGRFELADPLIDAVHRVVGGIGDIDHKKLNAALELYLRQLDSDEKRLDLSRALFRSATLSGSKESDLAVRLSADLIKVTKDFYHEGDYGNAVKFGAFSVEKAPKNIDVRSYYVRALVKEEMFHEAEREIKEIRDLGSLRDAYFLSGFMEHRRDRLRPAISDFEESIKRGRRGVAVHRELADCYFRVGNIEAARKHIDVAQTNDSENRFIVDLQIQIAIQQKDETTARSRLAMLKVVDNDPFYFHRLSTVEYAFGKIPAAYAAAKRAFESARWPTFAMLSQLIKCDLETNRRDDAATHLSLIDSRFPRVKEDIRLGLRCKWEISNSLFENALAIWEKLKDKTRPVHKVLRRDALLGLLRTTSQSGDKKRDIETEIESLNRELEKFDPRQLDIEIDDDR